MTQPAPLTAWHDVVAARDPAGLADLLADDVVFHSPVLHRPVEGRDLVTLYLTGALHVLGNDTFTYVREVVTDPHAVLEFTATVDEVQVNGVDMITWDESGKIVDFTVMLRPLRAIEMVRSAMAELLQGAGSSGSSG